MIRYLIRLYLDRHINRGFKQLEAGSRASTKLTHRYERQRVRELRIARERFESGTAGRKLA